MSRVTSFTDVDGRKWAVTLPDDAPDSDAPLGLLLGPPSLETLGLPLEAEVRLHNELFARRLWTLADVTRRRMDILGALQSAFKVDIGKIVELYTKENKDAKSQQTKRITTISSKVDKFKRGGKKR